MMSQVESIFCRSGLWGAFAGSTILPWSMQGATPLGDVLEVGCGSGVVAEKLLTEHRAITLTAGDYDSAMVDAAGRRLAPFDARARAVALDATAIDFPDASFDTVLTFLMLHHVIDWESAVDEMVRVLRPGGRLIGYDLLKTAPSSIVHRLDRSPHRLIGRGELAARFDELPVRVVSLRESWMFTRFDVER